VDLFDNLGTLVAVSRRAGLLTETHNIPRVGKILAVDACATIGGALLGTSTVTSYVESAAGIAAGGRTGVTAVVTGLLFLFSTFALPLVGIIPASATAPVLILVGMLMMAHAAEIRWAEPEEAIPPPS
jgi:AGZA family xanthine/uracil permease-like MFS transporter